MIFKETIRRALLEHKLVTDFSMQDERLAYIQEIRRISGYRGPILGRFPNYYRTNDESLHITYLKGQQHENH